MGHHVHFPVKGGMDRERRRLDNISEKKRNVESTKENESLKSSGLD